jgi:hypothetical protein
MMWNDLLVKKCNTGGFRELQGLKADEAKLTLPSTSSAKNSSGEWPKMIRWPIDQCL